jgi:hypothetical protein
VLVKGKDDALQMLEEMKVTLQQEIDLTQLSEHILTTVNKMMHPASASLWLFPLHQFSDDRVAPSSSEQVHVFGAQIVSPSPPKGRTAEQPPD